MVVHARRRWRSAIFNKAILWGMTSTNPVKGVKFLPEKRRLRFLMHDEIRILLEACSEDFRMIIITALNTGMRRPGHTFASHLVMNGIDLTTVKELLGHKSIQMTLRYAHLSQPHKKKAVETLTAIMDGHFLGTKPALAVNALPHHDA